jgi:hypothetical protein
MRIWLVGVALTGCMSNQDKTAAAYKAYEARIRREDEIGRELDRQYAERKSRWLNQEAVVYEEAALRAARQGHKDEQERAGHRMPHDGCEPASPHGSPQRAEAAAVSPTATAQSDRPTDAGGSVDGGASPHAEVPYRGTMGSVNIVLRLERHDSQVTGRYFRETSAGEDVSVQGSVEGDAFVLNAGLEGTFKGTIAADGSWNGTSNGSKSLRVSPVVPRTSYSPNPAPLYKRRLAATKKNAAGKIECHVDVQYWEAVGAFEPTIETSINDKLRPLPWASDCRPSVESYWVETVHLNEKGILSVQTNGFQMVVGSLGPNCPAAPGAPEVEGPTVSFLNVAVPSGQVLELRDIVVVEKSEALRDVVKSKIQDQLRATSGGTEDPALQQRDLDGLLRYFGSEYLSAIMERNGVRVTSYSVPSYGRGLSHDGLLLEYPLLTQRGLLRLTSPLAHLFEPPVPR